MQPFKRDFKEVVKTLGKSAQFTPYYVVYNGDSYGCTGVSAHAHAVDTFWCDLFCLSWGE